MERTGRGRELCERAGGYINIDGLAGGHGLSADVRVVGRNVEGRIRNEMN